MSKEEIQLTDHQQSINTLIILICVLIISLATTYFLAIFLNPQKPQFDINNTATEPTIDPTPSPTPDPLAPFNILLLGYGGAGHDGGELTDTMLLSHIRPRDKTITLISLPRDTWVPLQLNESTISAHYKINHAFALGNDDQDYPDKPQKYTGDEGGINLAKDTVQTVTNLSIKKIIAVSFDSFIQAIDILGGFNVYVPVTFDDEYYPINGKENETCDKSEDEITTLTATISGELLDQQFKCRYENLHFDQGLTQMDGETALKFVRSRHSEQHGGDFGRSQRQQALVKAIKDKVFDIKFIPKLYPLFKQFKSSIKTDVGLKDFANYLPIITNLKDYKITTINLNTDNVFKYNTSADGQSILTPKSDIDDWEEIHQFLDKQLNNPESTTSANTTTS